MILLLLLTTLWLPWAVAQEQPGAGSGEAVKNPDDGLFQTAPSSAAESAQPKSNLSGKLYKLEPIFDATKIEKEFVSTPEKEVTLVGGLKQQDKEIRWDSWYSKFGRAVIENIFTSWAEALICPPGLLTMFHAEVTADKHIKSVEITRSSGNLWFDGMVIKAIRRLDGDDVLGFPAGSMRAVVSADLGIESGKGSGGDLQMGDVEYSEVTDEPSKRESKETQKTSRQKSK